MPQGPASYGSPESGRNEAVILDHFLELASTRDLPTLLQLSLGIITRAFDAEAGSIIFYVGEAKRFRSGAFRQEALAHIERWESTIQRRLQQGSWNVPSLDSPPLTVHSMPGSGLNLVNSPLLQNTRVVGSVTLVMPPGKSLPPDTRQRLFRMSAAVGQMASLIGDLSLAERRINQLSLFYRIGQELVSTFDLNKLLEDTMQLSASVIDAGAASLMLIDEKQGDLVFEVSHGERGDALRRQHIPLDEGIAGWVARHGKPVISNSAKRDPRFSHRVDVRTGFLTQSIAAVPLKIKGRIIGVLEVLNKYSGEGFNQDDVRLMTAIAAQAAIAIENARLYQNLREERDKIIHAQEDVRKELARNLHDGAVQLLASIAMGLDHLDKVVEKQPANAAREIESLRNLTHQATREARMVLFELRPILLETQGLIPTLETYTNQLNESEAFRVHFEARVPELEIDTTVAKTIFSIIQEAVNNTKKHADARNVWITLKLVGKTLYVNIRDDGKGFDPQAIQADYDRHGSFGMLNMKERTELLDGKLLVESRTSQPNRGTSITLSVPIYLSEEAEARLQSRPTRPSRPEKEEAPEA